jgi:hypothetical protein
LELFSLEEKVTLLPGGLFVCGEKRITEILKLFRAVSVLPDDRLFASE